jgi:2-dehydropantoate 2-reductase
MGKLMKDKKMVKTAFNAMTEGYALCEKRGVNIKDFPECKMFKIPFFILYPMFKRNVEKNPVMERYMAHALLALEEMKDNFKKMYKSGKEMNFSMPNMDELNRLL